VIFVLQISPAPERRVVLRADIHPRHQLDERSLGLDRLLSSSVSLPFIESVAVNYPAPAPFSVISVAKP
jgi:hypothetical protein